MLGLGSRQYTGDHERATTPETTRTGSPARASQRANRGPIEVVVSPRAAMRNTMPNSSPPRRQTQEWAGATYQESPATHDDPGNEEDDSDADLAALEEYVENTKVDAGRQARIEAEYNAQKEKEKVHWCRLYSAAALLAQKGDKTTRMTWKSQHKYWMRLFCHKHQWYGKTPYKGKNREAWARECAREMASCYGKKKKCVGMVVKIMVRSIPKL